MTNYKSPIQIVQDDWRRNIIQETENGILRAVYKQNIIVDRDELLKALAYDRNQYMQGYEHGCVNGAKDCARRIKERLEASAIGARDSKDLSKFSAYFQAIEIVEEEGGLDD